MKHGVKRYWAVTAALSAVAACSSDGDRASLGAGPSLGDTGTGGTSALPPGMAGDEPKPEQELERAFRVPVVSGHWVWTANPTSGRVALIDAQTFTVKTALAGAGPTYLTALPAAAGGSRALVINSESQDATLFAADERGEIATLATLPVHDGANAWAVTADGRFALAWTDATAVADADPSQGFQDITVLDLGAKVKTSKRLSVGYRPARVFVDDDDSYVYVVTDAGIDVVTLKSADGPAVEREVPLSANPTNDTAPREVNITPDGQFAFVRREGKAYVTAVDLAAGTFADIALPGAVTDLDLSADASLAVAIIRDTTFVPNPPVTEQDQGGEAGQSSTGSGGDGVVASAGAGGSEGDVGGGGLGSEGGAGTGPGPTPGTGSLAVLLPVASIFEHPDVFDSIRLDEYFGSVALGESGDTALLFANGAPKSHLTLLDLAQAATPGRHRTVDLKLPIFTAVPSPNGAHAIALLQPQAGSQQPGAFAVVPVTKNLPPRIQGTLAVTVPADLTKDAPAMLAVGNTRALVTVTNGSDVNVAYLVKMPELTVDAFPLDSVPLTQASGLIPEANQAFVAQRHPEGRITFIDLDSKEQHTLTGFELSAQVGK